MFTLSCAERDRVHNGLFSAIGGFAVRIFYFRMSLKEVESPDIFSLPQDRLPYTRERWLRAYFSEQRTFTHRGSEFRFVPIDAEATGLPTHLIFGFIARSLQLQEWTPPSQGFEPTEHRSWRGALFILDPTSHEDGQKIGMERRTDIGTPAALLGSLASQMSIEGLSRPFEVAVFPIAQEASFWKFAQAHDYKINMIRFKVAPPNMFRGADDFSEEIRDLHKTNNVSTVDVTLRSEGVLKTREKNIREVIDYTEKGVGDISATTTSKASYSSKNFIRSDPIDGETTDPDFWTRLIAWLNGRF